MLVMTEEDALLMELAVWKAMGTREVKVR